MLIEAGDLGDVQQGPLAGRVRKHELLERAEGLVEARHGNRNNGLLACA